MRGCRGVSPWLAVVLCVGAAVARGQDSPSPGAAPVQTQAPAPVERAPASAPQNDAAVAAGEAALDQAQNALPPPAPYDEAIFQRRIAPGDLAFMKQMDGAPSGDAWKDKQFKHVVRGAIPNPMFHYGKDMPVEDAMDMVMTKSPEPVTVREGRYAVLQGRMGPYLSGRGMVWVDLQEGLVLGAFYFHPGNGEPTPTVTVFTKQIKTDAIAISQLPPAFAEDLSRWQQAMRVPAVETMYFIGDEHKKYVLEHDEDYCSPASGALAAPAGTCENMNADAADADMVAAGYLEQVHYATNATAYMVNNPDQVAWLQVRTNRCGAGPDPLGCRIAMTRERTRVILHRPPPAAHPAPRR